MDLCLCPLFFVEIEGGKLSWGFNKEMFKGLVATFLMLSYTPVTYYIEVLQYSVAVHTLTRNPTENKIDLVYEELNFTCKVGKPLVLLSKIIAQILMKIYLEVVPKLPMFLRYFRDNRLNTRSSVS